MLHVALVQFQIDDYGNELLSKKAARLKTLLRDLRKKFQISADEVDSFDNPELSQIAFCLLAHDVKILKKNLEKIEEWAEANCFARIVDWDVAINRVDAVD